MPSNCFFYTNLCLHNCPDFSVSPKARRTHKYTILKHCR